MPDLQHRYDLFWSTFTADVLKKMSTIWGAPNKLPKEERIAYLTAAPRDPRQVDAAIERMQPFERAALRILRGMGGTAPIAALAIAVRTTGLTPDTERFRRDFGVDPVADALLDLWCEREAEGHWRLTRESLERMLQRGRKLSELQTFLKERSKAPLPPLLQIALRTWAGHPTQAGLSTVVLFQCSSPAVLEAILESKALKPHLVGRIGPEAILVRSAGVQVVQAVLDWAGVEYKE